MNRHLIDTELFANLEQVAHPGLAWKGPTFGVFNPSTGELLAILPGMGVEEASRAIDRLQSPKANGQPSPRRTRAPSCADGTS